MRTVFSVVNAQRILGLGLATAAVVSMVGCDKSASLKSDQDKASYAIGMQIGKSLKMQNADVTVNALVAGLNDGLGGKDSKLKPEEMQAAMQKMQEGAMKKAQEQAEVNLKKGDEFLAANKAKPNVKTTESGLQYEVVKEGTGATPKDTDTVKVHYTGTLINGEKFDSSRDRGEPVEFPVNGVIPGWTEALKLMKVGAQYKLAIPAKLAYGPQGRPGIPPNSVLLFDVELLDVKPGSANPHMGMPPAPDVKAAKADKKEKKEEKKEEKK
jgi:FKBP-type peptidyl-prolyl cis-trans isomerase FkpA/FKBP-type peptidyl-prolyl cis-trans isomerase FklB